MITDKLRSYRKAKRLLLPNTEHRSHKRLNNRIENSFTVNDDPGNKPGCAAAFFTLHYGIFHFVYLIFIVVLICLTAACKPKSEFEISDAMIKNVPDTVIAVEPMIDIMTDIHLAEAWVQENKTDSIAPDIRLKQHYAEIYQLHDITDEAYKKSYKYYSANPVLMNYIYTKVVEQLNVMESQNLKVKKKI